MRGFSTMSKFKVLALAATLTMATAGLAIACDKTADAGTASAAGCASGATAQTASAAGCTAASTASAAGCSKNATADHAIKLETVRMPSGSLAVFYHGQNAETVAFLQSSANEGCSGFVCDMAKSMAADENVITEIAATETGVMILVTSDSAEVVDGYEAQYAAVSASQDEQGE
jgi:Fe-S cluster assembly iron-binding protein IscA